MLTIRLATPADAPALQALAAETFPLACPPGTRAEDIQGFIAENFRPEQFARAATDPAQLLLVAVSTDEPVPGEEPPLLGYTLSRLAEPRDPDIRAALADSEPGPGPATAEISKVYVRETAHGTGAASALMARTLAELAARDRAPVWLGVNQRNERAQRFYAKQGFVTVGTKRFRVGEQTHDDFVFARPAD